MPLAAGARIGPYEIITRLGAGGMGGVYRARDSRLAREVAIEILAEALAADANRSRHFEDEARAAGQLNHLNILTALVAPWHRALPESLTRLPPLDAPIIE
jgi:serine/threonine protein kinase